MNKAPRFPSLFYKQRLNAAGISMLCGVSLYLLFSSVSAYFLVLGCVIFLISSAFLPLEKRKIFLCLSLGLSLALLSTSLCQFRVINLKQYEGETVLAEGYVVKKEEDFTELLLVSLNGKTTFAKVRCEGEGPEQGDKIQVSLKVLTVCPEDLRSEGIALLAEGEDFSLVGKSHFISFLSGIRTKLISSFGGGETGAFLSAILLGERGNLSDEITNDFRTTASSHILAISGLHIAQFLGILFCLFRILSLNMSFARVLLYPLVFILYLLGGAGLSVFRASVMALFAATGILLKRRSDSTTSLVFAAVILVFFDPFTLENLSFLFSYISTFALVTCALPLCEYIKEHFFDAKPFGLFTKPLLALLSSLCISLVVFVFLLPLQLFVFDKVQLLSPLYALILVPLFQPILICGVILAFLCISPALFSLFSPIFIFPVKLFLRLVHILSIASLPLVSLETFSLYLAVVVAVLLVCFYLRKTYLINIFYLYLSIYFLLLVLSLIPR